MKMFLFLDDDDNRHFWMRQICKDLPVVLVPVKTAIEAIVFLQTCRFDTVFLDHDLDDTDPNSTGLTVAQFIALHLDIPHLPKCVIIHSHNPDGALAMEQTLKRAVPVKRVEFSFNR